MANPICEIISGGVINAEIRKIITIINLLFFCKSLGDVKPKIVNKKIAVGNWNARPKANASFKVNEMYSFIFGSNSTVKLFSDPDVSKEIKKSHARGIIK